MFFSSAILIRRLRKYTATDIDLLFFCDCVRLPGIICRQCREIAVLEVFPIKSLIIHILVDVQVCSAGGCHERSNFYVPQENSLVRVLDRSGLSAS